MCLYRVSTKQGHGGVRRWSLTLLVFNFIQAVAGILPGSVHICPQYMNVCRPSAQTMTALAQGSDLCLISNLWLGGRRGRYIPVGEHRVRNVGCATDQPFAEDTSLGCSQGQNSAHFPWGHRLLWLHVNWSNWELTHPMSFC